VRTQPISFLGTQTRSFDAMAVFVRDVLGLQAGHRDDGWAVFGLPSGDRDLLEVHRPGAADERLLPPSAAGPTVAFAVDDLVAAREELIAAGVEIVADVVRAAEAFDDPRLDGWGWLDFRASDRNLDALQQDRLGSSVNDEGSV
jgi:catechol 2,3-dioxygenase-like lactoylglutathione lyase family enzyme